MNDDDHDHGGHCFWCCPHMSIDSEDLIPDWVLDLPMWKFIPLAILFWGAFFGFFWWLIPSGFLWVITHVPCPFGGP